VASVPEFSMPLWFWRLLTIDLQIAAGYWSRASGDCHCEVCHRLFYDHPRYWDPGRFEEGFTLLCDGSLIHL
jgi:hypothetical protein